MTSMLAGHCYNLALECSNQGSRKQGMLLSLVPWALLIYGRRIRSRSKLASVSSQC